MFSNAFPYLKQNVKFFLVVLFVLNRAAPVII